MRKFIFSLSFLYFFSFIFLSCTNLSKDATTIDPDYIKFQEILFPNKKSPHENLVQDKGGSWLLIFYLNGDNEKNDILYEKLYEISMGIQNIKKSENEAKSVFEYVKAVALWDGFNKKSSDYKHYHSETSVFDFKFNPEMDKTNFFKNISEYITDRSEDFTFLKDNLYELNLGQSQVLEEFIKWTKENYSCDHTALILDGSSSGAFSSSRSASYDASSDYDYLTSDEISEALLTCGFEEEKKLDLLLLNSSYGATLEDAYELKNSVKALIASPSDIPYSGLPYNRFMLSLKKDCTIQSIGYYCVNLFASYYNKISQINSDHYISSLSFVDLSQIDAVKENLDTITDYILTNSENKIIDTGKYSYQDIMTNENYGLLKYEESSKNFMTDYAMFYRCVYKYMDEGTSFSRGHFITFDLGYFTENLIKISQKNGDRNMQVHATNLLKALQKYIVASWRNDPVEEKIEGLYPSHLEELNTDINYFGITITGPSLETRNTKAESFYFQPYKNGNLNFQKESSWYNLLYAIFPEQF